MIAATATMMAVASVGFLVAGYRADRELKQLTQPHTVDDHYRANRDRGVSP